MNVLLNGYMVSEIPLRNSIIRKRMWIQKAPTNRQMQKTFQITVTEL
jgi:hypothetical protein